MSHLARTLERDQQRIALAVIEAAASHCEEWRGAHPLDLARGIRALKDNVDEIIGRVK